MMKALSQNKKRIIHNIRTPGPSNFFDPETYLFLDNKLVFQLIESGVAKLEISDIPYIILIDTTDGTYYDTAKQCLISESRARQLCDSRFAELRLKSLSTFSNDRNNSDMKERVLLGATAAGGTTVVAAGAASVPFLAGFTSSGIAVGSLAACIQSSFASVAAGTGFAVLQSIAATTLIGTALPVAVAGAAVAGTTVAGVMLHRHRKKKNRRDNETELIMRAKKVRPVDMGGIEDSDELIYDEDIPLLYHEDMLSEPPRYDDVNPPMKTQPPAYHPSGGQ